MVGSQRNSQTVVTGIAAESEQTQQQIRIQASEGIINSEQSINPSKQQSQQLQNQQGEQRQEGDKSLDVPKKSMLSKFLSKKQGNSSDTPMIEQKLQQPRSSFTKPDHLVIPVQQMNFESSENQMRHLGNQLGNKQQESGNSFNAQKLLQKQKTMLQKQKKMIDQIQKKNVGGVGDSNEKQKVHDHKEQRSSGRGSMLHIRTSKSFNQSFLSTVRQKIIEAEREQRIHSTRAKINRFFHSVQVNLMNFMVHTYVEIFMGLATIFSLYSEDIRQVAVDKNGDIHFNIAELVVLLLFFTEIVIFSFCKKNYFFRFNFWMDLVSTISILFDISFLTEALFGFTVDTSSVSVLKASRVSRIASRATKIVRFVRLLRISKLQSLYKQAYDVLNSKYKFDDEDQENEVLVTEPNINPANNKTFQSQNDFKQYSYRQSSQQNQQQSQHTTQQLQKSGSQNNNNNNGTSENLKTRNSHQNLDIITERTERPNQSYNNQMNNSNSEDAQIRLLSPSMKRKNHFDDIYTNDDSLPFRYRVNSFENHGKNKSSQNNSIGRNFFRRRSFDTNQERDMTGVMTEQQQQQQQTQSNFQYSLIQATRQSRQAVGGGGGSSNNDLPANDISVGLISLSQQNPSSPKKRPADRKSILSHFSQHSNPSHENQNLFALSMLKRDSIKMPTVTQLQKLPSSNTNFPTSQQAQQYSTQLHSQVNQHVQLFHQSNSNPHPQGSSQMLKSVQFFNPGQEAKPKNRFDAFKENKDEKADDLNGSVGSANSLGFDDPNANTAIGSTNKLDFDDNTGTTQKSNKSKIQQRNTKNAKLQKRESEDSKIGQQLASITINRVIVMVFSLLVCIPFFDETNYIAQDDSLDTSINFLQDEYDSGSNLLNLEIAYAIQEGMKYDSSDQNYRYPMQRLTIANEVRFPNADQPYDERQFKNLRDDEVLIVQYQSTQDPNLLFEGQYIIKLDQDLTSYLSIGQTTFIIIILGYSTVSFAKDINKIVVSPIERMLVNIRHIADNPLLAAKMSEEKAMAEQELKKNQVKFMELSQQKNDETYLLESTIMKIGALLAIGFGEAGSKIITKNMRIGGRIDPMIPGKKLMAIFGFCSIKNFADATEILQEKVMIFANEIAELVHIGCDSFHGAINKNLGDCFLLVWKFTEDQSQLFLAHDDSVQLANQPLVQNLSDLPVTAFLKTIANIRMLSLQPNFAQRHLKPLKEVMPSFKLRLGFGLHVGWGIEGAIGSHFKIDASYLSPNVNMASRLENATKQYGLYLLISGALYRLLSPTMQTAMRHVDRVTVKGSKQPMDLYTCDVNPMHIKECKQSMKLTEQSDHASNSNAEANKKVLKFISRKKRTERYRKIISGSAQISKLLESDVDIATMRQDYTNEFRETYHEALNEYFDGEWESAKEIFEEVQCILKENMLRTGEEEDVILDGPTQTLMNYMAQHNFRAPGNWFGYRVLVDK